MRSDDLRLPTAHQKLRELLPPYEDVLGQVLAMGVRFSRTLRSLDRDRPRRGLWLIALVVCGWLAWLFLARVPIYEVSQQARLEVFRSAHPLASLVDGRVVSTRMRLGAEVQEGELLLELDTGVQELARQEKQVKIESLRARREALNQELSAERETLLAIQQARERGVDELQAKIIGTDLQAKFAHVEAERGLKLSESMAISAAELNKLQTGAATTAAALVEARAALQRMQQDRLTLAREQQTRIVRLERQAIELAGEIAIEQAAIPRLNREILDRRIVAPVRGRLDEVASVRAGSVVTAAQRLAVIIPPGEPRAVAHFPVVVVGRIRSGQHARLRLDGFPWTQYGTVAARVADVGTEPSEGLIRVELLLQPIPGSAIPIEHGLTGSVEIAVERASPAVLVLRAAGQFLGTRRASRTNVRESP